MKESTEQLLRFSLWVWVTYAGVYLGLTAGEFVKNWSTPSVWTAPPQLAAMCDVEKHKMRRHQGYW